jgi:predicted ATP-dependent endonuclease of OLD family
MLSSISIKGFKAIQGEKPLELKNLAKVNYLVGPNGSGKSSVLETLQLFKTFKTNQILKKFTYNTQNTNIYLKNLFSGIKNTFHLEIEFTGCPDSLVIKKDLKFDYDLEKIFEFKDLSVSVAIISNNFYEKVTPLIISRLEKFLIDRDNPLFNRVRFTPRNLHPDSFENLDIMGSLYVYSLYSDNFIKPQHNEPLKGQEIIKSLTRLWPFITPTSHIGIPTLQPSRIDSQSYIGVGNRQIPFENIASGYSKYSLLESFLNSIDNTCNLSILIEEPETHLHANLQKKLPFLFNEVIHKNQNIQFFISTHSPFIVNAALEQDDQKVYHLKDGRCLNSDGISKKSLEKTEEKISSIYSIHGGLGMVPSDLLFANCMIWVEGPTDAIYIEFWLRKYCEENTKDQKQLKKGFDYDFSLFGGASAENFYLLEDDYEFEFDKEKEDQQNKIFDMLKIHPKSFVVMDNDWNQEKECGDSNFEGFKTRIKESKISYHYEESKSIHTIELYRKDISEIKKVSNTKKYKSGDLKHKRKTLPNKKKFAFDYTKQYKDSTLQECLKPEGIEMINKIYTFITQPT